MSVTHINYIDQGRGNPPIYQSVDISYSDHKKKFFKSGDFVKDWYDHVRFIIMELSQSGEYFMNSSTVDHFIMDGAPYISAYMIFDNNKCELKYGNQYFDKGIELFVHKGTRPSWRTIKDRYNDPVPTVETCKYYGHGDIIMHCLAADCRYPPSGQRSELVDGYCVVNKLYECNKSILHRNFKKYNKIRMINGKTRQS